MPETMTAAAYRARMLKLQARRGGARKRRPPAPPVHATVTAAPGVVVATYVGLHLVSRRNAREHWRERQRIDRKHRTLGRDLAATLAAAGITRLEFGTKRGVLVPRPTLLARAVDVTLTRIGTRRLDDDNAIEAMKNLRDGIADALGVADHDERVRWRYGKQELGDYAARVEIRALARKARRCSS